MSLTRPLSRVTARILLAGDLSMRDRLYWIKYNAANAVALRSAVARFNATVVKGTAAVDGLCGKYSEAPPIPTKSGNPSA
jgi:hypothetical protein